MSTDSLPRSSGRGTELALTAFAVLIAVLAYASVGLAVDGEIGRAHV